MTVLSRRGAEMDSSDPEKIKVFLSSERKFSSLKEGQDARWVGEWTTIVVANCIKIQQDPGQVVRVRFLRLA